ncbi:MAG: alkaline phosphatase D family protein [Silvanigrellaceae bacterium]
MGYTLSRRNVLKALGLAVCTPVFTNFARADESEWVLGFGSCMSTRRSQNFWKAILSRHYNHWVFLGDNVYPQRDSLESLRQAYVELGKLEQMAQLRSAVSVSATWDDHDFGADNADSSLPYRMESMQMFKDFWSQDYGSSENGVYSAHTFEHQGRKIHLILLDLRFNRTPYAKHARVTSSGPGESGSMKQLTPQLLGDEQWRWFEAEMEKPADLKIVGSSIQVLSFEHNFEKWKNYPEEYDRLMTLVGRISSPTIFLSGDRHLHEISKNQLVSGRTLYDFTSSGLNKAEGLSRFERNRLRMERCLDDGFGEIRVRWDGANPVVTMQMIDDKGSVRFASADTLV